MSNLVILKGRLSKDVELKTTTNGTPVASFSVAVNRRFVKEGEERQADFFNVTAWNKLGEFASKYFSKGQEIYIQGRLENRTWDDENGMKHYATDVIAEQIEFCGSKKDNVNAEEPNVNQAELTVNVVDNNSDDRITILMNENKK